ncbi:MAG: hypothetical protein D6784_00615, partial [Chloroflexi bacterium]
NDTMADSNVATVNITINPAAPVTIASHNFDDNKWNGGTGWNGPWSRVNSPAPNMGTRSPHSAPRMLRLRNTAQAARTVNLTGVTGAQLTFWWKARAFESGDKAVVQINDGSSHTIFTINNGDDDDNWHKATIDLSSYNMTSNFEIRFKMQGNSDKDYLYLDDIEITGIP